MQPVDVKNVEGIDITSSEGIEKLRIYLMNKKLIIFP